MKDKHLQAAFEEITNIIMSEFPPTKQGKLIKQTLKHYGDMRVREVVKCKNCDGSGGVAGLRLGFSECPMCGGDGHCLSGHEGESVDDIIESLSPKVNK